MKGWIVITVVVASIVLIIISAQSNDYAINKIAREISRNIGEDTIVFLLAEVNKCCRPLPPGYDKSLSENISRMIFSDDFSIEDINNFRYFFHIPDKVISEKMDEDWKKLYEKLNFKLEKGKYLANFLFDLSEDGRIENIKVF